MFSNKIICSCANCGHCFEFKDAGERVRKLYNINVKEKVCPNCGSVQFENIADYKYLDKFLFFRTIVE